MSLLDPRKPLPHIQTPAEAAYYAYWRAWPVPMTLPWVMLSQHEKRAWQHVARVLLAWGLAGKDAQP